MSFSQDNFLGSFAGAGATSAAIQAVSDAAYFKDGSKSMEGTMSLDGNIIIGPSVVEVQELAIGILPATDHVSIYAKDDKMLYIQDDTGLETLLSAGLDGPAGATVDNRLALWDGITGNLLKQSTVIIDVAGDLSGLIGLDVNGINNISLITGNDGPASINLLSTAGGIVIASSLALDIDSSSITMDSTSGSINIQASGGSIIMDTEGVFTINIGTDITNGTLNLGTGGVRTIFIGQPTSIEVQLEAVLIDVNATTINLDATAASNYTVTGTGDLTLSSTLGSVNITSGEGIASSILIDATAIGSGIQVRAGMAGIDILTATGAFALVGANQSDITVTGPSNDLVISSQQGRVLISGAEAVADSILLEAPGGAGIDINAGTLGITIDSTSGFSFDAALTSNVSVSGDFQSLTLSSAGGSVIITGNDINMDAATGGFDLFTTGAFSIDSTSTTVASNISTVGAPGFDLTVNSTAGSLILASGEADLGAIVLITTDLAGGIEVDSGTGGYNLITTGNFSLDGAANSNVTVTGADLTLSSVGGDLFIIGGSVDIAAAAGGFIVDSVGAGLSLSSNANSDISITGAGIDLTLASALGRVVIQAGEVAADAILLNASGGGGIDINTGSTGIDIDMALGTMVVTSTHLDTSPVLTLEQTGVNGSNAQVFVGSRNPSALVTGIDGSLYIQSNGASSNLWQNVNPVSGTLWKNISLLPPRYLEGFILNDNTATTKTIGVGSCLSSDGTFDIINTDGDLDIVITTSGVGGLDTGVEAADTWYFIYIIADSAGVNIVQSLMSISSTSPNMPAGYDRRRLIGAIRNNTSSNFYNFNSITTGRDKFYLWNESAATLQVLSNGQAMAWANVDMSEFVPPISTLLYMQGTHEGSSDTTPDFASFRADGSTVDGVSRVYAGQTWGSGIFHIETSSSQIIEYENNGTNDDTNIFAVGFTLGL